MSRHRPRKRFGQNFLHDQGVLDRIIASIAPMDEDAVVEIGPGRGALTRLLVDRCRLTAIEIDRDLAAALRGDPALGSMRLVEADVLDVYLAEIAEACGGPPLRLVGNLPYNVSSPVLFWALAQRQLVRDMHFMLQKEVVDRMGAPPGSKTYGRLSVMVQYACRVDPLFRVPPGAFFPAPKVDSAVVRLTPRPPVLAAQDEAVFATVVKKAFAQRRKTLGNALKGLVDREVIEGAGIDPGLRAEALPVEAFVRLANAV